MSEVERRYHEEWLGMVQPIDGLVVSIPVLVSAQCMNRHSPELQHRLRELCLAVEPTEDGETSQDERRGIADLSRFFTEILEFRPDDLDDSTQIPKALSLYVPEGRQTVRPTLALRRLPKPAASKEAPHTLPSGGFAKVGDTRAAESQATYTGTGRGPLAQAQPAPAPVVVAKAISPNPKLAAVPEPDPEPDLEADPELNPAANAGRPYLALVWDLAQEVEDAGPDPATPNAGWGLPLDKPETSTGAWHYPPAAKFERLLRHARVPIGILTNRTHVRLIYAPHGESTGSITFPIGAMTDTGGRPILDALVMLLSAPRWFSVADEHQLPSLLAQSRQHQAEVTNELADQVFEALEILLQGFEHAAERDGWAHLDDALQRNHDHLYGGLLTVLLRTVFLLYAEDRGLMPVEHDLYAEHHSVLGLFERLQSDFGAHPDAMHRRFGAWSRLIATWRLVYLGAKHGDFEVPARKGQLFDPNEFPFLEGWGPAGSAPIKQADARAATRMPSIDDGTVFRVLERLLYLDRQRLSYRALDVEQIGSVYEALMGYHVVQLRHRSVGLRPQRATRVWVSSHEVLSVAKAQRAKWLQQEAGLTKAMASKVAQALDKVKSEDAAVDALATFRVRATEVLAPGRLVIQPGHERRRTSTHYTPRSLTEPVVRRTLEPHLSVLGDEPLADQILDLKICDPAMGTGAFLVEVCRFLGDQVVAAWTREGRLDKIGDQFEDPVMHARRLVAQRCVYGVDKNPFAVNLAKLSLWLATLAKNLPFTFLDHALRHGDSLVGLSFDQIKAFHWDPEAAKKGSKKRIEGQLELDFFGQELDNALSDAVQARQKICDLARDESPKAQADKARLLADANDAMDRCRTLGDLVIGAFFSATKDKDREKELERRKALAQEWLQLSANQGKGNGQAAKRFAEVDGEIKRLKATLLEHQPTFHWMVEYPEIFYVNRPDPLEGGTVNQAAYVDAFVGNPPFLGGSAVSGSFGDAYLAWLLRLHEGAHGNADLCAHFFRRVDTLLGAHGAMGLIATNTIGQGDTRTTSLQYLVTTRGYEIYNAIKDAPWSADLRLEHEATGARKSQLTSAAVTVSVINAARGAVCQGIGARAIHSAHGTIPNYFPGRLVTAINSRLRPKPERADPVALSANENLSFLGSKVYGQGFVLTPDERDTLIKKNRKNAERIFPYLGGEEVNTNPDQGFDRYVINFGQMTLAEAERWPDLLAIVRTKVKPERDKLKNNADGRRRKEYWWQFGRYTPALFDAIRPLPRCLVTAQVTKHLCFSFQPTDRIFSQKLIAFPLASHSAFAVLQSRIHITWTWFLSSTMKTDLNYSPSDAFQNFPFPYSDPQATVSELEKVGERLYAARAKFMLDTNQGLTKIYNLLKDPTSDDPRILELRDLHLDLDRAVLQAYGWNIIAVPPYTTPQTPAEHRLLEAFEDELIDRLFTLNTERANEGSILGQGRSPRNKTLQVAESHDDGRMPPKQVRGRRKAGKSA